MSTQKKVFLFFQEMPRSSLPLVSLFAWSKEMFTKDANVSYNNAFFFHQLSQAQIDWRSFQKETRTNVAFKRRTHSLVLPPDRRFSTHDMPCNFSPITKKASFLFIIIEFLWFLCKTKCVPYCIMYSLKGFDCVLCKPTIMELVWIFLLRCWSLDRKMFECEIEITF